MQSMQPTVYHEILQKDSKDYNESYPLGYVLFTVEKDTKEIKQQYGNIDPNWKIDWDSARVIVEKDLVILLLPTLITPNLNYFYANKVMLDDVGEVGIYEIEEVFIEAKIVDKYEDGFICLIGLRKAE